MIKKVASILPIMILALLFQISPICQIFSTVVKPLPRLPKMPNLPILTRISYLVSRISHVVFAFHASRFTIHAGQAVLRVVDAYMRECVHAAAHLLIYSFTDLLTSPWLVC